MFDKATIFWWGFGGVIWGAVIALGSLVAAGAGHGWVSALPFGILSLFTTPLVTIAWVRRKLYGRKLAAFALGIAVLADALLILATLKEGIEYFYEVYSMAVIWIILWSSWQWLAIIILFTKKPINQTKLTIKN